MEDVDTRGRSQASAQKPGFQEAMGCGGGAPWSIAWMVAREGAHPDSANKNAVVMRDMVTAVNSGFTHHWNQ